MKIGDYVRTDRGTIFKVENITEIDVDGQWFKSKTKENSVIKDLPRFMYDENDEHIIKSSPNIIDLIEDGDYANGHLVIKRHNDLMLEDTFDLVQDEDIKSIVTKEQFERGEYKI